MGWLLAVLLLALVAAILPAQRRAYVLQYLFFCRFVVTVGALLVVLPLLALGPGKSFLGNLLALDGAGVAVVGGFATLAALAVMFTFDLLLAAVPNRFKLPFFKGDATETGLLGWLYRLARGASPRLARLRTAVFFLVFAVPLVVTAALRSGDARMLMPAAAGAAAAFLLRWIATVIARTYVRPRRGPAAGAGAALARDSLLVVQRSRVLLRLVSRAAPLDRGRRLLRHVSVLELGPLLPNGPGSRSAIGRVPGAAVRGMESPSPGESIPGDDRGYGERRRNRGRALDRASAHRSRARLRARQPVRGRADLREQRVGRRGGGDVFRGPLCGREPAAASRAGGHPPGGGDFESRSDRLGSPVSRLVARCAAMAGAGSDARSRLGARAVVVTAARPACDAPAVARGRGGGAAPRPDVQRDRDGNG